MRLPPAGAGWAWRAGRSGALTEELTRMMVGYLTGKTALKKRSRDVAPNE